MMIRVSRSRGSVPGGQEHANSQDPQLLVVACKEGWVQGWARPQPTLHTASRPSSELWGSKKEMRAGKREGPRARTRPALSAFCSTTLTDRSNRPISDLRFLLTAHRIRSSGKS